MAVKMNVSWLLPIVSVALGLGIFLLDPHPIQVLRNAVFDQYQRWSPRVYQDAPVRILDIDEESLRRLGQWPWPRTRVAELVERLRQAGAAAIVFDVMFTEPDRTSPRSMGTLWQPPAELGRLLRQLPDHDEVLARSFAQGGVVLAHTLLRKGAPPEHFARPFRMVALGPSPLPFLAPFESTVAALPGLQEAAAGNGAINFLGDTDGVIRRVPLMLRLGDHAVPSLVAEALRVAQGARNILVKTAEKEGVGLEEARIGQVVIPTNAHGEIWVHYTRPEAQRTLPAWKALAADLPAEAVNGRIVLIGSSAQGLMDLRFSPMGGVIPGVENHAQALEQILTGVYLERPRWAQALEAIGILVLGLVVGFTGIWAGAIASATTAAVALALTNWGGWYLFTRHGLLLDPVTPGVALSLIFILTSLLHHAITERRQRWVRQAFARYLSPNLVSYIVDHPEQLELGGERRVCTFLFTDLAGFTPLMEKLDPTEAVSLLNEYLDNMIRIAFQHEATLDRIVGDALVIMFSAPVEQPDHRQRALRCAREMHLFARKYAARANARGIPFGQTRIGIHTGEVTVGNFGGSTIFDYRALGDPINAAARLETVNKQLGTLVCVSEATLSGSPETQARTVGRLILKGKSEPLLVFEPLLTEDPAPAADAEYQAAYELMARANPDALAAFEKLHRERPDDPLANFHLKRLRAGEQGDLIVFTEK